MNSMACLRTLSLISALGLLVAVLPVYAEIRYCLTNSTYTEQLAIAIASSVGFSFNFRIPLKGIPKKQKTSNNVDELDRFPQKKFSINGIPEELIDRDRVSHLANTGAPPTFYDGPAHVCIAGVVLWSDLCW